MQMQPVIISFEKKEIETFEKAKENVSNNTTRTRFAVYFHYLTVIRISSSVTFEVGQRQILPRHTTACVQHIATNPPSDLVGPSARLIRLISGSAALSSCALHPTSSVAFALFPPPSEQRRESRDEAPMDSARWFLSASALNN